MRWAVLAIASWAVAVVAKREAADEDADVVKAKLKLLWPIHFTSVALSSSEKPSFEPADLGAAIAQVSLKGFRKYVNETLPRELEIDQTLAHEFRDADHSRVNKAFRRWQRRAYAIKTRTPTSATSGNGQRAPRLKGIDYRWDEFYQHPGIARFHGRIDQLTRLYNKRMGADSHKGKFRIFSWVEVFDKGDAHRPMSYTDGAFVMGRYFAQLPEEGAIKMSFEDPRGINPPFGKTFSYEPYEGNIVLFPTWVSHFITPNMKEGTVVSICFVVYASDGETIDWEDDRTGSLEVPRSFSVERALPTKQKRK